MADGSPLPDWVSFNSTTRNLLGAAPPVVTVWKINILADDSYGGIAKGTQTITIVNTDPHAGPAIFPNQIVKPTIPFNFSFDANAFIEPDGDPLTYSVTLTNQQPLPDWLTFNQTQTGGIFTGTAPAQSAGSRSSVNVTAADPFGAIAVRAFGLNVARPSNSNAPPYTKINPPNCLVGINKQIVFQISNNTFFDADYDPLTYSASTVNGSALPAWLNFEDSTRFFFGTAPNTPLTLPITVQAEDLQHIPATANFNLFVEGAPQVLAPISNLAAIVGTAFKFIVPKDTFQDLGIQNAMTWSAVLTTGAPLPAWLIFDPTTKTFTGMPSRKDTNAFSSRPLPIRLMAGNSFGTALVDFIISVQGESDATLAIKIVSGIWTTFLVGGVCIKHKSIWKKSMKCVFQLPTDYVTIGQESEYCHSITRLNPNKIASVQLLRDGKSLPVGIILPEWLIYDASSAKITINAKLLKDQDGLITDRWTVQVKNKGSCVNHLVWEEFDIKFVTQLSYTNADDELRDTYNSIAMKPPKSRHEELRQPLIVAPIKNIYKRGDEEVLFDNRSDIMAEKEAKGRADERAKAEVEKKQMAQALLKKGVEMSIVIEAIGLSEEEILSFRMAD